MSAGDHLCLFFDSAAEQGSVVRSFVLDGIRAGHQVLYLGDDHSTLELGSGDHELSQAVERGQVGVIRADQIERARPSGYSGLRIIGGVDLTDRGCDRLSEYERQVCRHVRRVDDRDAVLAICPYDRRRFEPSELAQIERLHAGGRVRANDYYDDGMLRIGPTFSPPGAVLAGEVDITVKDRVVSILRQVCAQLPGDVHLDLHDLTFCDVGGLRELVQLATDLARTDQRLVLDAMPRFLREMIRLCGWSRVPWLDYEEAAR